ncbi:putative histone acetyltransferase domain, MYST-type, acyl-CoA N-acyltransferase [Septoria linicola]|nr:putative histone acetyltransferase domain, MYST-type, acyl-CoA N-acyltransferase [Septoria linicola]
MAVSTMPTASIGIQSPHRPVTRTPMAPNVKNIVLGERHIKPEYPSFYSEDLVGGKKPDWLYVCQWCFKYTNELLKFSAHCKVCPMKTEAPHGEVVYEKDNYSIHRLDGEEHKLYSQNLSLFAKLFLETKSVFFDATTFLFYTLVIHDPANKASPNGQVVGFFSKEKMSWDNNNLACIVVFPPWQKRGLGQVLIAASYVLGRRENRFGGPERPLSADGSKSYIKYWTGAVTREILTGGHGKKVVSVKELAEQTWIMPEDVVVALKEMDVFETRKTASGNIVVSKTKVRAWAKKHRVGMENIVDVDAFVEDSESEDDEMSDE